MVSPYIYGQDYISITDEVIKLARQVPLGDFTEDEVIRFQYMRYSQIKTETNRDDWTPNDREFGVLQLIETKLVASDLLEHYGIGGDISVWQSVREGAIKELVQMVETTGTGGSVLTAIGVTPPKSWNLNPSLPPPNRLQTHALGGMECKRSLEINN